ncbi:putative acetyltransferase [Leishmania mexicana MHOM/GT/2001/U1103]|uniref:Acetyltransferase n=1 Tax=Leishmania mexicana (strain MHOM/GT/2001/U1103) TaxID=929439 RepID=E9AJP8_LEIMU|nr:putative acetyltransferase [Leishmania mexicana MHOM/GT/2001/U1103]CBZ23147.1 putative acetyltransferase [Leishmania mexicana MHOM/GT/2001/U1103]
MSVPYEKKTFPPLRGLHIRPMNDSRLCERIKVLDDYCFPVKYTESYYNDYVRNSFHEFNQLAFYHDILVGSITCRLEKTATDSDYVLYIMTIGVLEAYRHLRIGSRLLQTVLSAVYNDTRNRIVAVTLHVQVGSPALEFYRQFNFEEVQLVENYYTDLDECNAILLRRVVPQPHFEHHKKLK